MKTILTCTLLLGVTLFAGCIVAKEAQKQISKAQARKIKEAERKAQAQQMKARQLELQKKYEDQLQTLRAEIRRYSHAIANEEVSIASLAADASKLQERERKERAKLAVLKAHLESEDEVFTIAGRQFSREEVEQDVQARSKRLASIANTVVALNAQHEARQRGLREARDKVEAMQELRDKWQARLDSGKLVSFESQFDWEKKMIDWSAVSEGKELQYERASAASDGR